MIRPPALVAPLFRNAELHGARHSQRRFRSFIRRVDKNNQIYYEPTKRGNDASQDGEPRIVDDLFEMPDLLLDLDAEDSPHVRLCDQVDEERMRQTWEPDPRRAAVRDRLRQFESELSDARKGKTRTWRPSQHDILSAALLGSPGAIEAREAVADAGLKQQLDSIAALGATNRIPPHAAKNDSMFLEWLLLRCGKIGQHMPPEPSREIAAALREQKSIKGIRRITFQSLDDIADTKRFANDLGFSSAKSPSIPHEIRAACLRVCDESRDKASTHTEALDFLGNLARRFWDSDLRLGALTCALALRMSAELGSLVACTLWISRGRAHGLWRHGDEVAEDVQGALDALLKGPEDGTGSEAGLDSPTGRQQLLQIMTGLDEDGSLTPYSIREISIRFLKLDHSLPAPQAYAIYKSYIRLLGKLGAIRTLHFEAKVSSRWARQRLAGSATNDGAVDALFHEALLSALRMANISRGDAGNSVGRQQSNESMSLEECAALDCRSIDGQRAVTRGIRGEALTTPGEDRSVLSLSRNIPFKVWLAQVEEILRVSSPGVTVV